MSVTSIGEYAFDGGATIYVYKNSYAQQYVEARNYETVLLTPPES